MHHIYKLIATVAIFIATCSGVNAQTNPPTNLKAEQYLATCRIYRKISVVNPDGSGEESYCFYLSDHVWLSTKGNLCAVPEGENLRTKNLETDTCSDLIVLKDDILYQKLYERRKAKDTLFTKLKATKQNGKNALIVVLQKGDDDWTLYLEDKGKEKYLAQKKEPKRSTRTKTRRKIGEIV